MYHSYFFLSFPEPSTFLMFWTTALITSPSLYSKNIWKAAAWGRLKTLPKHILISDHCIVKITMQVSLFITVSQKLEFGNDTSQTE